MLSPGKLESEHVGLSSAYTSCSDKGGYGYTCRSFHLKLSSARDYIPLGPVQNAQDHSHTPPRYTRDLISDTCYNFYLLHDEHEKHERRRAAAHDNRRCRPHGLWHAPHPPSGRTWATRRRPGAAQAVQRPYSGPRHMYGSRGRIEKAAKSTKKRRRRGRRRRRPRQRWPRRCPAWGWCPRCHWRRSRRRWRYLRGAHRAL